MPTLRGLPRLPPPPADADADADLLGRYVAARTEAAFAALVRRHGPMVLGVCRRRLGRGPDADDAFQVTFLVLARDAARVGRRESLPGWLYRVAYLVALKMSGTRARHRPDPLPDDPRGRGVGPDVAAESGELRAALDEELAALPDKLRAVVVLCGLEERTNADAAKLLGCPTGTVDSRLSAARARLRARLARRGWPVPVLALDALLRPPAASAAGASLLFDATVRAAVAYAAGGCAAADPLATFANGVSPAMSTVSTKLLVAAGLSLAVVATAGLGLLPAPADDGPKPPPPAAAKADPPKKDAPVVPKVAAPADDGDRVLKDEQAVRRALALNAPDVPPEMTFRDVLELLTQFGIHARFDTASFKRMRWVQFSTDVPDDPVKGFYTTPIFIPHPRGMTVAHLLAEAVAQLRTELPITYQVRGNQVLIVPAFMPPATPGAGGYSPEGSVLLLVEGTLLAEQVSGVPVSIAVDEKPLAEVLTELRQLTGANIVLDNRCKEQARQPVSGTFDDVRLFNVLTVLADMCDLKPAYTHNVYYVTLPKNADEKQKAYFRDLNGEPPPPPLPLVPGGGLGGGFERPAPAKP